MSDRSAVLAAMKERMGDVTIPPGVDLLIAVLDDKGFELLGAPHCRVLVVAMAGQLLEQMGEEPAATEVLRIALRMLDDAAPSDA